jgi:hypothetical protein
MLSLRKLIPSIAILNKLMVTALWEANILYVNNSHPRPSIEFCKRAI